MGLYDKHFRCMVVNLKKKLHKYILKRFSRLRYRGGFRWGEGGVGGVLGWLGGRFPQIIDPLPTDPKAPCPMYYFEQSIFSDGPQK